VRTKIFHDYDVICRGDISSLTKEQARKVDTK